MLREISFEMFINELAIFAIVCAIPLIIFAVFWFIYKIVEAIRKEK